MATVSRTQLLQTLPSYTQAAEMIQMDPTGVGRAVRKLQITPLLWGGRDKRLQIVDVLRIAQQARRASVDEVAGSLLDAVERDHPEMADEVESEIDRYFDEFHPQAPAPDNFLAEMRAALSPEDADAVERIYKRYVVSSQ
jgi:hypothetical protein